MLDKPRIYIAAAIFYPLIGGVQKQVLEQARSLHKRGYQVTIITLRYDKEWLTSEVIEEVPIIRVAGTVLGGREKLPRFFQKLCYLIAMIIMGYTLWQHRKHYDLLHVYQLNLLALPTTLACWLSKKPMIISVRSANSAKGLKSNKKASLIAGTLDITATWMQINESNRESADLDALERLGKPVVYFTRFLLQHIGAVVVVLSSRMISCLAEHDFYLPDIQLIPNGVDITRFTLNDAVTSQNNREQIVICISRLYYSKGIDVLIQAWRLVHEQLAQARLIIVGDGPLRTQLECVTNALGITDSIEFAGMQSNVVTQLHRGSISVLPSRWEGMPNAVLEAMACGLTCVATRVSGSEDIITHGVNGLLVEPEDYMSMAQALLILLHDPELAQKYGSAARTTIEQRYPLDRIIDMYEEVYRRMIDRRGQTI